MRIIVTQRVEVKPDQELFFVALDQAGQDDWNYRGQTGASPEQIRLAIQTLWQVAEQWLSDQVTGDEMLRRKRSTTPSNNEMNKPGAGVTHGSSIHIERFALRVWAVAQCENLNLPISLFGFEFPQYMLWCSLRQSHEGDPSLAQRPLYSALPPALRRSE